MKLLLITVTLLACAWAQNSEYLPPAEEYSGGASNYVETNFLDNEPAHSLADDGYRYRTVKRFRLRHRRDVSELSNDYLPPQAASAPEASYSAPAFETYEVEASEPAHTFADDGYRYRTVKRYRLRHRHRRDVSELTSGYLPPNAASASGPAPAYTVAESAPAPTYSAPAEESYEVEASEPAHTLADDGYRYRTVKRYRLRHRHRRDVSELTSGYLPPNAASASGPAPAYTIAESAPAPTYSAPAEESYEVEASEPAHTFADDGYRYRTVKRYRLRHRHRRDVSELTSGYLPPNAASASGPAPAYTIAESAPAPTYSAPSDESYEVEASEPAHTLAADGYRYRTVKRYRLRHRHRRDVSELTSGYLPPNAASASGPAPAYTIAESAPAPTYSAPAEESYEVEASEPAHTFADDGYRYRTVKRYRLRHRHRRDVSELTSGYLPPNAASASGPAPAYTISESSPAPTYSAPAVESYEVEASEPAHTLTDDGYRYRTVKRYRLRHRQRRDVSELTSGYLPPNAASASGPAPAYTIAESAPAPTYSAPAVESYEVEASEPAHTLAADGYRYRTVKRYRHRRRY